MAMYTISQGDCLSSIAHTFGFGDWKTIYNDPNNASFRSLRPDPNIIFPGDQLFIPEIEQRVEEGATDRQHVFQLSIPPVLLRLVLLDRDHQPLANVPFKLELDEGVFEGQTGSDGLVEQAISPSSTQGRISVTVVEDQDQTGYTWNLLMGALDPQSLMTGIQGRLNNLGYNTGVVDGILGPRTTEAIKQFQTKYNLDVDGVAGPITSGKLVEVHGC